MFLSCLCRGVEILRQESSFYCWRLAEQIYFHFRIFYCSRYFQPWFKFQTKTCLKFFLSGKTKLLLNRTTAYFKDGSSNYLNPNILTRWRRNEKKIPCWDLEVRDKNLSSFLSFFFFLIMSYGHKKWINGHLLKRKCFFINLQTYLTRRCHP